MNTTKAKERFRKLWASINKDNKHLTTEMIEDLIESEVRLAHQAGREEMRKECLAAVPERLAGHYADEHVGSVLGHNDCRELTITNIKNIK